MMSDSDAASLDVNVVESEPQKRAKEEDDEVTLYDCWNAYLFKIVVSDVIEWAESASWLLFERLKL